MLATRHSGAPIPYMCLCPGWLRTLSSHQGSHVRVIDTSKKPSWWPRDNPYVKFTNTSKKETTSLHHHCCLQDAYGSMELPGWTARAKGGRVRSSSSSSTTRSSIGKCFTASPEGKGNWSSIWRRLTDIALNRSRSYLCGTIINGKLQEKDWGLFLADLFAALGLDLEEGHHQLTQSFHQHLRQPTHL